MRLAYVVRGFPKTSETFVLREVRELVARGCDVTVFSLLRPDPSEPPAAGAEEALRVTRYPERADLLRALARTPPHRSLPALAWAAAWAAHERNWRHLAAVAYAAWIARAIEPGTHVHAHFANVPATVALLAARLRGTSWSFTGHANDMFVATTRRFLARKVSGARVAVVGTEYSRAYVRAAAPSQAAKVALIRNGLDAAELAPAAGGAREPRTVVAVGRLVEKKGIDTLVAAAALLRDRGEDVLVRVVGDGPQRAALERQVTEASLGDRVALLGARAAPVVRSELAGATVFALPCRVDREGDVDSGPLAIIEAMAQGTPVVSTPVGGIAEVVRDGDSGLLVAARRPRGARGRARPAARRRRPPRAARRRRAAGRRRAPRRPERRSPARAVRGWGGAPPGGARRSA